MANMWRDCLAWLIKCKIIPGDHRASSTDGNIEMLFPDLRDGVLLCNLVKYLDPKCLENRNYNSEPQMNQGSCHENIKLFLEVCRSHFMIPEADLFDPPALYDMKNAHSVIETLAKLSQCPKVRLLHPNLTCFGTETEDQLISDLEQEILNMNSDESLGQAAKGPSLQVVDLFSVEKELCDNTATQAKLPVDRILPDSSDDEDPDTYFSRKFNEYGQAIQQHMKKTDEEKHDKILEREVRTISVLPSKRSIAEPKRPIAVSVNSSKDSSILGLGTPPPTSIFTDPIFGMRIIRPLVSSSMLADRMAGKKAVSSCNIKAHVEQFDKSMDWVVAGAIISKSPIRVSQKGDPYSIWQISDLRGGEVKTVGVFLFKGAHSNLWKTAQGMIVALLNPNVLESRSNSKDEATLSVDNVQKVMILGQSKDLGTCKSKKKNGDPCGSPINLRICEYCIFHVKKEFSNISKRADLQSSTAGRGLSDLKSKVLGKAEIFYAGQSYSAVPAVKNAKMAKKDQDRLLTLSEYFGTTTSTATRERKPQKPLQSAPRLETSVQNRAKDLERLKLLKAHAKSSEIEPKVLIRPPINNLSPAPTLSKEKFTFEVSATLKRAEFSRLKAVEKLKHSPIPKANPNHIKYRGTTAGRKRIREDLAEPSTSTASVVLKDNSNTSIKRPKLDDPKQNEEQLRKTRIQRIMESQSSHTNLIVTKENEAQQKYFDVLERKEQMEERMVSTTKVPCKAVICLHCKYLAFQASDLCKTQKHKFKLIDAEKRFFKCANCSARTASLDRFPKHPCSKCQSSNWTKTGMMAEKMYTLSSEKLSIRGDEEMYIGGATSSNINLNLHVAEEEN